MEGGSSSGEKPQSDYQVFLSFRGCDARQGFTDCLYHFLTDAGVRVFRDNEELRPGHKIREVLTAINRSIVCIPILSKNYANSKWCLLELAEMVKLKKDIMPIFYKVEVDDVKLKTRLYSDHLSKFGSEYDDKKEEWIRALEEVGGTFDKAQLEGTFKEVGRIKAWTIMDYPGYGELCKEVVHEVLQQLEVKHKIFDGPLVGIDGHVEAMMKLLDIGSPEVWFIVIHGVGGVGKTTLSKVIFNQLCDSFQQYYCFLDNVRETANHQGIVHLQNKLLRELSPRIGEIYDIDSGIKTIKDIVKNKRVLIILDDLDQCKQIESLAGDATWFDSGSRIIVTTRDSNCVVGLLKLWYYNMSEMSFNCALQLFCRHAFKMESPPAEYLDISKQVVAACGHLPLALEVMGSYLHHIDKKRWKSHIDTIASHRDVRDKLMISFKALDLRTKEIFLDIVCFFVGSEKKYVVYMWEACDFRPDEGIERLSSMSLVKISKDNTFWMHDLLRDLGREIVIQENLRRPERRSRLWLPDEVERVLSREKGTCETNALKFHHYEKRKGWLPNFAITPNQIRSLQNLSYLELEWVRLEGDFKDALRDLKWLSWHDVEVNAANLVLEDIVVLDLSWYNDTDDFLRKIKIGEKLKVLKLSDGGTVIPFMDRKLEETSALTKYPAILGSLRSLIELEISCVQFKEIPTSIGNLSNLRVLRLNDSSIRSLPSSIGDLEKLEELHARESMLQYIPEDIGRLLQLRILDVSRSKIRRLPSTIDKLPLLQQLHLEYCKELQELPNLPSSLTILRVSSSSMKKIPSLVNLGCLNDLLLRDDSGIWGLPVQHLFPNDSNRISSCPLLESFELTSRNIFSVEMRTDDFPHLKRLRLDCAGLKTVGQLPSSLTTLHLRASNAGTRLDPCLGEMEALSDLELLRSKLIGVLPLPRNLKTLHIIKCTLPQPSLDLSELKWLQHLKIDGCRELKSVCGVENMEFLERITVVGCSLLREISDLSNFKRLVVSTDNPGLFEGNGRISVVNSENSEGHHHY